MMEKNSNFFMKLNNKIKIYIKQFKYLKKIPKDQRHKELKNKFIFLKFQIINLKM